MSTTGLDQLVTQEKATQTCLSLVVVVVVVVVVVSDTTDDCVLYDHLTSTMQRVTENNWWQVTWESDSRRPRHRALDNEELYVVEGSQKIN